MVNWRSLEPISLFSAGAFSIIPKQRPQTILRQTIVVATIRSSGSKCSKCGKNNQEEELTVETKENEASESWFVPWNLDVICYQCKTIN